MGNLAALVKDATEPQRDNEDGWDATNRRGEAQRILAEMSVSLAAALLEAREALERDGHGVGGSSFKAHAEREGCLGCKALAKEVGA